MSHEWTLARLSEALDGTLPAEERTRVEGHLAVCRACSEVRDDLVKLTSAARELGPLEPARDLWPAIEARLERRGAAGSERGSTPLREGPGDGLDHRFGRGVGGGRWWRTPQLAAAAVVLMTLSASVAWWARGGTVPAVGGSGPGGGDPGPTAVVSASSGPDAPAAVMVPVPEGLAGEMQALESVLAEGRGRLDPSTVEVLEQSLSVIERAIEEAYRALASDPENDFVREHLERSWERKRDYLREVSAIVEMAG